MKKYSTQPKAQKIKHIHDFHGHNREDHYFWLRDKKWPNVTDKKILSYLKKENNYTAAFFAKHAELTNQLFSEMKSRITEEDTSYPILDSGFYYYTRTEKGKNYSIYCRKKKSMQAAEEILLDVNQLATGHESFRLGSFKISHKKNMLAYSVDIDGKERYKVFIKDLNNNEIVDSYVENIIGDIIWHKKKNGFFYLKLDDNWRHNELYFHKIGTKQELDILIHKEYDNTFNLNIYESADEKMLFISSSSSNSDELRYLNHDAEFNDINILLTRKTDQQYSVNHGHNKFYIKINDQGKNFRLASFTEKNLHYRQSWQEIIAHNNDIYLTSFSINEHYILVNRRENGVDKIEIFQDSSSKKSVLFDEEIFSASGYFPKYNSQFARINYSSLTTPLTIYEYNFSTDELMTRKVTEILGSFEATNYKSKRIYATASDESEIPISLVYNKNKISLSSPNPLYLYGYGSYGIGIDTSFNSNIISLLDRGFIFAIAHVRGGDELGYKWYEEAKFLTKKLTFSDFIACAETVITNNYTSPEKLVISGGSAGGMLMAAVLNSRPELFKAAIARVAFVDVLNTMLDSSLPLTPSEYKEWGNPDELEYYNYILSYCPYHNIKKQSYPSVYATAGLTDPRVGYWEPAKWIAKLREYNTGDKPILLETEMNSGHGGKTGRFEYLHEISRIYSFAISQMDNK